MQNGIGENIITAENWSEKARQLYVMTGKMFRYHYGERNFEDYIVELQNRYNKALIERQENNACE